MQHIFINYKYLLRVINMLGNKMKNKIILVILVFTSIFYSQDESIEESLKYYPLQIGNYWQYESSFHDGWGNDTNWFSYREVVGDTIMPNGLNYFVIIEDGIKTIKSKFVRIDSINGFVYSYKNITEENREDSLVLSDWDSLNCNFYGDVYIEDLLGSQFETRPYNGCTVTSGCTKSRKMSKNIGLIELKTFCANVVGSEEKHILNYVKVNNIEYGSLVSVENTNRKNIPSDYDISQNYPNPFNPKTNIIYYIPEKGLIDISVYDILGEKITSLFKGNKDKGTYTIQFDGSKYSSGVYYYVLSSGNSRISKKMLLIK